MGFGFSKARLRLLGIGSRNWLGRGGVLWLGRDVDMAAADYDAALQYWRVWVPESSLSCMMEVSYTS